MAQAMIDPLITNGYQPAEKVTVYDVSTKSMENIQSRFPDIQTSESIGEAVHEAECVVLAVKPQNISEAFWKEFPPSKSNLEGTGSKFSLREDATLVSILAGKCSKCWRMLFYTLNDVVQILECKDRAKLTHDLLRFLWKSQEHQSKILHPREYPKS